MAAPTPPLRDHAATLRDRQRLEALHRLALMDTMPEVAFDRIVRLATEAIGTPIGLLSLVDGERQFFKAQIGLEGRAAVERETPLSHSFCQYVVTSDDALVIEDARMVEAFKTSPAIADLGVVAYLGVPVHSPEGQTVGSFCTIDTKPHVWTERERRVLGDLAAVIESELALRQEAARRQLLVRELNHRVKNLFAVVSGMITLTARTTTSANDMAVALRGRVHALAQAHELIRPAITQEGVGRPDVSLQALVASLIEPHLTHHNDLLSIQGPALTLGSNGSTNLALVLHELATNAAKYGSLSVPQGRLEVSWEVVDDEVRLTWRETGGPSIAEAPERRGFGSRLVDMTVQGQLGGSLTLDWLPGGVHYRMRMPVARLSV